MTFANGTKTRSSRGLTGGRNVTAKRSYVTNVVARLNGGGTVANDSGRCSISQHLNAGMDALIHAAAIAVEFRIVGEDLEQAKENVAAVRGFCEMLITVESQITDFQQSVASLPRMTTALNRAKRALVNVLQRLIDEFRGGQAMAREAEA